MDWLDWLWKFVQPRTVQKVKFERERCICLFFPGTAHLIRQGLIVYCNYYLIYISVFICIKYTIALSDCWLGTQICALLSVMVNICSIWKPGQCERARGLQSFPPQESVISQNLEFCATTTSFLDLSFYSRCSGKRRHWVECTQWGYFLLCS